MKYSLPLRVPRGRIPLITQPYGDKSRVEWYRANGLNLTEHNGVDIVISGPREVTYGAELVCPVPAALVDKMWFDTPMSTKGNGIQIAWSDDNGYCQMLAWHCSGIVEYPIQTFEGQTIGYIGNSGLVDPPPTAQEPFAGSHVHLMLYINGVLTDPMNVFELGRWFTAIKDTGTEKDLPALYWAFEKAKLWYNELVKRFKGRN